MSIRTESELKDFENVINHCHSTVYVVTPDGTEYDLKSPAEHEAGIEKLVNAEEAEEAEIFATTHEDEMAVMDYMLHHEDTV